MNRFSITAVSLSLTVLAGCSTPGDQVVTATKNTALRPAMTAPVEVVKRNKADKNRIIRVTGDRATYVSSAVDSVQMTALPEVAAPPTAANGAVRVAGGARIEGPMSDAQVDAAIANAQKNAPPVKPRKGNGNLRGPQLKNSWDAIGAENCCNDPVPFSATVPPDPDIAVGPDHVIVVVNVSFAIFDRKGNELIGPTPFSAFFAGVDPACGPGGPFDPDVVYDELSGEFIIGVDGNGTDYCIAATDGGDPLGTWHRAAFPTDVNGEFFDFPHMGVSHDAVYVGSNQFGAGFVGGRVFAVNKANLLAGDPLQVVQRLVPDFNSTPQPANLRGANDGTIPTSGPHYIMTEVFDGENHSVWSWTDPFGADEFVLEGDVNLATASGVPCPGGSCFPVPVPQATEPGSATLLAGNDWRGQETKYRNGFLYTAQTISCDPGTGVVNCVRWAKIDPEAVTPGSSTDGVADAGVYSQPDGVHRWFPSIDADRCGNVAVGYSVSSPSMFPGTAVTGRQNRDQAGTMRNEVITSVGTESYRSFQNPAAPNRWGDYSGMAIDPEGKRFYYAGEYARESENPFANWAVQVSEHKFPCGGRGLAR